MDKEVYATESLVKVSKTTCYMCACRCGIDVHIKDNEVVHIEGNRDHPVNKGVLCAKGASGIFQHKAASRLKKPLRRVGERRFLYWSRSISIIHRLVGTKVWYTQLRSSWRLLFCQYGCCRYLYYGRFILGIWFS